MTSPTVNKKINTFLSNPSFLTVQKSLYFLRIQAYERGELDLTNVHDLLRMFYTGSLEVHAEER